MAPLRGKKAAVSTVVETVADSTENDTTERTVKPKNETKKSKPTKNVKRIEQNDIATNCEVVKPAKAQSTTNKSSTKNAKQTAAASNEENVALAEEERKSKRTVPKKNYKEREDGMNNVGQDKVEKSSTESRKRKDEPAKVAETEATKVKSKKVEPNPSEEVVEPSNSKAEKKIKKDKSAKNDEVVERVRETRSKRGARKVELPELPVQKPKGRVKKLINVIVSAAKSSTKSSKTKKDEKPSDKDDGAEEDIKADSSKGRKRKPPEYDAVKSPAKKTKNDAGSDVFDGPSGSKENSTSKKRKATTTTVETKDDFVTKRKKPTKIEAKGKPAKTKINATDTDFSTVNFESDKKFTTKIVSWNVAGLRAVTDKKGFDYFEYEKADIICLQEIKCLEAEVPQEAKLKGYHPYWCSKPGGLGGVAILSKSMPYNVEQHIGDEEMDKEGRIITADYLKFFLVCVYVPNAGQKLNNLPRRLRWNKLFEEYVNKLKAKKPVIIVGDMNVAHEEIDLENPKSNRKNAGFSDEERAGMTSLLGHGFVDTFRDLHPNKKKAYTFWSYRGGSRAKNVGWRLDYSIVSENIKPKVVDSFIRPQISGSDHCPIVLLMNI